MAAKPNIVDVAALIGDASRVTMLLEMLGGKALPASELALAAHITPQTASSHLAKLVEGGPALRGNERPTPLLSVGPGPRSCIRS